jgi:hypothetical protein
MKFGIFAFVFALFIGFGFQGCMSTLDEELPALPRVPVVNAMLACDSLLSVEVSFSMPPGGKEVTYAHNARVEVWKDEVPLGLLGFDGISRYQSEHRIVEGANYRVEVQIPGFKTVSASTLIPRKTTLQCTQYVVGQWAWDLAYDLRFEAIPSEVSAYYILTYVQMNQGDPLLHDDGIYCNSTLADPFNRALQSKGPAGFNYLHDYFVRCGASSFIGGKGELKFASMNGRKRTRIYVIAAGNEYDKYFKSVYLQRSFDYEVSLPFSYHPVPLPSNIKNGLGVFAGVNIQVIDFY